MRNVVDLNSDIGEGFGSYVLGMDDEIIQQVSSVNIACGWHAGDPLIMEHTVIEAINHNVGIGAHPGYADFMGFGRRNMDISPKEARSYMIYQLGALSAFAKANGGKVQHMKLHGAFYNMASVKAEIAEEIINGILDVDKDIILLALSGSYLAKRAAEKGLKVAQEVFADRGYNDDGTLVNRNLPGAFIHDKEEAFQRIKKMVLEGSVDTINGKEISIVADSICVHGDNPMAVDFVRYIKENLIKSGIQVKKLGEFI
ncbi:5-oxoprolinase subunit PxpA [Tissierella sp.]|uniref:LamB/YcsF family protein n=1 Tax=Tissierella sp. TaxID=41274 RepID=UPI002856F504|nr:5-oxoprolinase subunit PxpA [Tissierella sp.]MDR7857518.1 5-oxoprolinase subunit PxpA [Tissierella sp.]